MNFICLFVLVYIFLYKLLYTFLLCSCQSSSFYRLQTVLSWLPFRVVGSNGLGPSTSRLSGVCSNQLSYEPIYGGGNRVRTDDPLLAGQVLYQLSYTPIPKNNASLFLRKLAFIKNE